MTTIFTDLDGVVCIATNPDGTGERVIPQLCRNLSRLVVQANARLVISSDWRLRKKPWEIAMALPDIQSELMHPDPLDGSIESRWKAIQRWLERHPEVNKHVILDDSARMFDGAPESIMQHLILCNGREGLVGERVGTALRLLRDGRPAYDRSQFIGGDADDDADL